MALYFTLQDWMFSTAQFYTELYCSADEGNVTYLRKRIELAHDPVTYCAVLDVHCSVPRCSAL